jgi:hypothetical protein
VLNIYFASIISVPSTLLMRKVKDPDLDPFLGLMGPDSGCPETCGSGSPTLTKIISFPS